MYIEKGNLISKEVIKEALLKLQKQYKIKLSYESNLDHAVSDLYNLNEALINNADVFAICEKEPRGNLDTGNHYYSVFYTKENKVIRLWLNEFTKTLGGKLQSSNYSIPHCVWYSGAIGMSRLLDATDGIFTFLKSIGGCYCQLDCK